MKAKSVILIFTVVIVLSGMIWLITGGYHDLVERIGSQSTGSVILPVSKDQQVQKTYEKARRMLLEQNYPEAKKLCLELLSRYPEAKVSREGHTFRVGPAALDMLAENYIRAKNSAAALDCYRKMTAKYRDELFNGYRDGEAYWYGKAGAAGLIGQITVLIELDRDFEQAKKIAYQLIEGYNGQSPMLWEWTISYEEFAAGFIQQCLLETQASPERTEQEYRKIMAKTGNKKLAAELLLSLADKRRASGEIDLASSVYQEVIAGYGTVYSGSELDEYRFYGLEAYQSLIDFYQGQSKNDELAAAKTGMAELYEKLVTMVKASGAYESARETLHGYQANFQ